MNIRIIIGLCVIIFWANGCLLKELEDVVPVDCPQANFTVSSQFCVPPCTIKCTDLSLNTVRHEWYFDEDSISRDTNPSITFQSHGVHAIRLIAYAADGCTDDTTIYVLLSPQAGSRPFANFLSGSDSLWAGCASLFQNTSLNYTSLQWLFGDGQFSTEKDPFHTFTSPGDYSVTLKVLQNGVLDDTTVVVHVYQPQSFSQRYNLTETYLKVGGGCQLSDGSYAVYLTGDFSPSFTVLPQAHYARIAPPFYQVVLSPISTVSTQSKAGPVLPTINGNVLTITEELIGSGHKLLVHERRPDGSVQNEGPTYEEQTIDENHNIFVKTTDGGYSFVSRNNYDLQLVKLNATGEESWKRAILNVANDTVRLDYCLASSPDGGIVVASSDGLNLWVTKYSDFGQQLFKRSYVLSNIFASPTCMVVLSDGSIYLSLFATNSIYFSNIIKLDVNGNLINSADDSAYYTWACQEDGRAVFYGQIQSSFLSQYSVVLSHRQTYATDLSKANPAGAYLNEGGVLNAANQFLVGRITGNDCRPIYLWQGYALPYQFSNISYFTHFYLEK